MRDNVISVSQKILLITFYLLLQFQFAYVLEFPITVSLVGLVFFLTYFVEFEINYKILLSISFFSILSITNQLISNNIGNEIQFLRTFLLVLFSIVILGNAFTAKLKLNTDLKIQIMLKALTILAIISILQAILGYRFGSFVTSPLGKFSYQYQYTADLNSNLTRASGLYSEPSFNALVCLSFLPIVLSIKDKRKRITYSIISSGYMISTFSLTGILSLGLIFLIWFWEDRKIRMFPILSFAVLIMITSNYIFKRWQTLSVEGSSANYRLVAPLRAIIEVIPENLVGIPLGSLESTFRKFEFLNGNQIGSSVDNGYALLILYFGMIGVLGVALIFIYTLHIAVLMSRKNMYGWQMVLIPSLTLNFNGGIFLPDFLSVLTLIIITLRLNISRNLEEVGAK